ncbi:MAG: pseudaminic acid synthase [Paracoccaceae bacterium]
MKTEIKINDRKIGFNTEPYIIAELSGNHNGDINRAIKLIDAAVASGAHAIKLQTYTADTLTIDSNRSEFIVKGGPWSGQKLYDLYKEASTPWEWHPTIFQYAKQNNIHCFSSPFDNTAVDFLNKLSVPAYKIASFEIVDIPLIKKASAQNKPLIMSTGVADYDEIEEACVTAKNFGADGFALLHCVSDYPSQPKDMQLKNIQELKSRFNVPIGLSDHSLGSTVAVAAIALGATLIEKHITLSRLDGGPDASFSSEPDEFKKLVQDCENIFKASTSDQKNIPGIKKSNSIFRRSIYVVKNIKKDEVFSRENIRSIRPGLGIQPKFFEEILGKKASIDLERGEPLSWKKIIT